MLKLLYRYRLYSGIALIVLASLSFGTRTVLLKQVYSQQIPPSVSLCLLALQMVALTGMICLGRRLRFCPQEFLNVKTPAFLSAFTVMIVTWLFNYGLQRLPMSVMSVIFFMFPIWMCFFAYFRGEKVPLPTWLCVLGAFTGVVILIKPSGDIHFSILGIILAFSASIIQGWSIFMQQKAMEKHSVFMIFFWSTSFMLLTTIPFLQELPKLDWPILGLMSFSNIFYGLGIIFGFWVLLFLTALEVGVWNYIEPVVSVLMAIIFLGEIFAIHHYIGITVIILSLLCFALYERKTNG